MGKIEILAPAGEYDSVVAAVRCGADAVYVGAKDFSARASAKNFDTDELKTAVKYCHQRGVSVYLALNTLVFDDEISRALDLAKTAAKCDIDAVIVQDIGLATAIKSMIPNMRLHASTQMSVHTLSGAQALYEMGFDRVVLAREMSKAEIKEIADNCPIELEVFVHGALCMCVSGQCYMSATFGSRSANRGKCAQPCRLPFAVGESKHALSLKDNSIVQYLKELQEIGVTSAKIEGRMKRPEYVATATSACRQMRDNGTIDDDTARRLSAVFSRTGFTDGYYTDNRGYDMFGYRKKDDVVSASEKLLKEIRNTYKDEAPRVRVDFDADIAVGKKIKITATDSQNIVIATSDETVSKAQTAPANEEKVKLQLSKTGNTPFYAENININLEEDSFVSAKSINELRRQALDELLVKREKRHNYDVFDFEFDKKSNTELVDKKTVRACVNDLEIPLSFSDMELVFAPLKMCVKNPQKVQELINNGIKIAVEIPRGMFGIEQEVARDLKKAREMNITDAMCNNIGATYLAKNMGFRVHLGAFMNITNSLSLKWAYDYGVADAELSIEADADRIDAIYTDIPTGVTAYGYMPLMMCRNCPVKSANIDCATCKKTISLQDRKGESFSLLCGNGTTEILNCVPLILPQKIYKSQNVQFTTFRFYVENSVETKEKTREKISKNQKFERFTHGLYIRGVK